ncbi:MAG: hypothetical protein COA79_01445 [Planctomycetota bacterium]|nr:MAG: hypothetical protein COA79_01445 [Planctomycetota bacterium]
MAQEKSFTLEIENKAKSISSRCLNENPSAVSSIIKEFELDEYAPTKIEIDQFEYFIATDPEDRKKCFELINEIYLIKGYLKVRDYKKVIAPYDVQETTIIVAARNSSGEIVATISIFLNNEELPSYHVFPEEMEMLKDKKVAEITRLAIHDQYRQSKNLLMGLFWYVYSYSYQVFECDHTLIEVNPRHVGYYKRFLFFKVLSEEKKCQRVQGAPALLLTLTWETFNKIARQPDKIKNLKRSFYKDLDVKKDLLTKIKNDIITSTNFNDQALLKFDLEKNTQRIKRLTFKRIVKELCTIVGRKHVKEDLDTRLDYGRSTLESGTTPLLIVHPKTCHEVQQILAIANEAKWTIHPISTGKNWGYSDACALTDGVVLLDLKRMNKIISFDKELGTIAVEPGVTQGQVAKFLLENNYPFMIDATGAGPDTSLIGNTAERGFGHSPNGDRFANSCGYEVVLANGEIINTGFGNFKESKVTDIFKWGVGPSLDGLFTQSNLGVITKMTFWMQPKPECFKVAYFMLKDDLDIAEFIDRLRPLRMDGTLKSVIHMGNDVRIISMSQSYPWEEMKGVTPMSLDLRNKIINDNGMGAWSGTAGLYGSKDQVKADIKKIKQTLKGFKGLKKMVFLGQNHINLMTKIAQKIQRYSFGKNLNGMAHKIKMAFDLLKGQSPETCVQGGLWRTKNNKTMESINSTNPLDYKAGFYWISPMLPMKGDDVIALKKLVEPIFHSYGFDLQQTLSMTNERSLCSVMTISFDKNDKTNSANARICHDKVVDALMKAGYIIYRAGNHSMKKLDCRDNSYQSVLSSIKKALDPNNILSPGKYNI